MPRCAARGIESSVALNKLGAKAVLELGNLLFGPILSRLRRHRSGRLLKDQTFGCLSGLAADSRDRPGPTREDYLPT